MTLPVIRSWKITTTVSLMALAALASSTVSARIVTLNQPGTKRFLTRASTFPEQSLKEIKGVTAAAVDKIMAFRAQGKGFSSIVEFRRISGVSDAEFEALAAVLTKPVEREPLAEQAAAPPDNVASAAGKGPIARKGPAGSARTRAAEPAPKLDIEVRGNYYSILPGYDLGSLGEVERKAFLDRINGEMCPCGCKGETLGFCIVNDPGCPVVKARVKKIYTDVVGAAPASAGSQTP